MENILISESEILPSDCSRFSRVFTTVPLSDTDNFYDFWNPQSYVKTYQGIFDTAHGLLKDLSKTGQFVYRDVELLRCFRHDVFLFMLSAEIMHQTFQALRQKYPDARFHIAKHKPDFLVPYLSQILSRDEKHCVFFEPEKNASTLNPEAIEGNSLKAVWPSRLSFNTSSRLQFAIYADYYRSSEVMKRLPQSQRVYFTRSKEPKIALRSFLDSFAYIQTAYSPKEDPVYLKKAAAYSILKNPISLSKFPHLVHAANEKLQETLLKELPALLFHIDQSYRFFENYPKLKSVLMDEDISPFKQAFCQIAHRQGKSSFVECHGAVTAKHGFMPVTADHIFVWGSRQKEKLIQWGCPSQKIIISGCSKYEKYKKMPEISAREIICKTFQLNPAKKTILFTPFPREYSSRYFMAKMIRDGVTTILNVLSQQDAQILIKLHPCEMDKVFYRDWVDHRAGRSKMILIEKFDSLLLAKGCDFAIIHDSTMAVDAFALGKNVIFFPALPPEAQAPHSATNCEPYEVFYMPKTAQALHEDIRLLTENPLAKPLNARWADAQKECLNEGSKLPEEIIAYFLMNPPETEKGSPHD